jgi:tetratricopeptide (TPR) repeat protein
VGLYAYYQHFYKEAIKWITLKNRKGKTDKDDLMWIARSYYFLGDWHNADSVFNLVIEKHPDNIPAYVFQARALSSMDPTSELGLAEPKFLKVIEKIGSDSATYLNELQEAYTYLGYNSMQKKDYQQSKSWYKRLYNLDPTNKQWQLKSLRTQVLIATSKEKNYPVARDLWYQIKKLDPADPDADKMIKELTRAIESAKIFEEINNMK